MSALRRVFVAWYERAVHLERTRRVAASLVALLDRVGRVGSVLDVGGGDGRVARHVADALRVDEVRGVDVLLQPDPFVPVQRYDGRTIPYEDGRFDVVLLSDVLHHAEDPERLLSECLRVAREAVVLKDHFAFGPLSDRLLWLMDVVGNAAAGIPVRGRYFHPRTWFELVDAAGGRIVAIDWPVRIHDLPWRVITRSELQFTALVEQRDGTAERAAATADERSP